MTPGRKRQWAWSMYDWANSAYSTSMVAVFFSVYVATALVPAGGLAVGTWRIPGESVWAYLTAIVMAGVVLIAPPLGAVADRRRRRKSFLLRSTAVGVVATALLYFATPERPYYGLLVGGLSFLAYEIALVFYNALLTDVAKADEMGSVSGLGFALGYFGGGLALAVNILMVGAPGLFGLAGDATQPIRAVFVFVAAWWALFTLPLLRALPESPAPAGKLEPVRAFIETGRHLRHTVADIWRDRNLARFLLAFFIYNDGIQTLLLTASIVAATLLDMTPKQLGLCILLIQFVAFFGALLFGRLADKWSHKKVVLLSLVVYAAVAVWSSLMRTQAEFWFLGAVVGLVLGGSQSASRSLFALLIPPEKSGELFSFYGVVGKAAAIMGPLVFGVLAQVANIRAAAAALVGFYVIGGLLLLGVKERRAPRSAFYSPHQKP